MEKINFIHTRIANEKCGTDPIYCMKSVWRSVHRNWPDYWTETFGFDTNVLVDRIPWKIFYYRIASRYQFLFFPALVITLILIWKKKKHYRRWIGVSTVPAYVLGISLLGNRFNWYEGQRLKFFLEPTLFVFLVVQGYMFAKGLIFWARHKFNVVN